MIQWAMSQGQKVQVFPDEHVGVNKYGTSD